MKYDFYKKCYEKNAAFVEKRPALKKALPLFDKGLTALFFLAYIGLCLYALVKNVSGVELMKILFPPLLCLLVVTVLRFTIDKPRPYMAEGAGITPLITKKKGDNQSFPSRHIASATVIATTFLPFFPAILHSFPAHSEYRLHPYLQRIPCILQLPPTLLLPGFQHTCSYSRGTYYSVFPSGLYQQELISPHIMSVDRFNNTKDYSFLTNVLEDGVVLV